MPAPAEPGMDKSKDQTPDTKISTDTRMSGEPQLEKDKDLLEGEMSLIEHLTELRSCIVKSFIAIFLGFLCTFYFAEPIYRFLARPLIKVLPEADKKMIFTSLPEVFFVYIKVALFSGIIVASPVLFYQLWKFVAPGLYKDERKYVIPFVLCSTAFFLAGASFAYFQIFPLGFKFFVGFQTENIEPMITMKEYLKFATRLLLAFGIIFEMPIVSLFLSKLGILTPAFLRKNRKYAILIMVILAAILTPPDVVTQLMMAGPMMILYEVSIIVSLVFGRKKKKDLTE